MRGNNKIYINQATMLEAIQIWLDAEFINAPGVFEVRKDNEAPASGGTGERFVIIVGPPSPAPTEE